ncbi:ubx domain-containing protein 2 [Moniliophthora roreri MCA 2997]|uniref:Ubx domain-containing protein 2 n=2 Tax=Moniliophthora roreri TaxID=221103 RepID=V2XT45_MONRO|nr:ubx domain-containing protein 2 [Moniliophthora roreri MCA 2997]KAI3612150.1 ubx domain-containing protein 2 [Moniliophthora roreri]
MASQSNPSQPTGGAIEAAERRRREAAQQTTLAQDRAEHERRQLFRRLIDPGIMRPNSQPQALESLRTINRLCQNILNEPENTKFHRIKTTNTKIQKDVVTPKGTVELLRELGFRPEVEDFQPYYIFNLSRLTDLRTGSKIINDALQLHTEKEERTAAARQAEKEAREQAAEKVKLAYMDDRRAKSELDERERQRREALAALAARKAEQERQEAERQEAERQAAGAPTVEVDSAEEARGDITPSTRTSSRTMPGGQTLSSHTLRHRGSPPPYEEDDD